MLRTKMLASVLAAGCLLLGGCLQTSDTGTEKELETAVTTQTVPSATAPAALTAVQQVERVRQAMALNYFQIQIFHSMFSLIRLTLYRKFLNVHYYFHPDTRLHLLS